MSRGFTQHIQLLPCYLAASAVPSRAAVLPLTIRCEGAQSLGRHPCTGPLTAGPRDDVDHRCHDRTPHKPHKQGVCIAIMMPSVNLISRGPLFGISFLQTLIFTSGKNTLLRWFGYMGEHRVCGKKLLYFSLILFVCLRLSTHTLSFSPTPKDPSNVLCPASKERD